MAASGELTAENLAQIAGDDLANQLNSVSGSAQATATQLTTMAQTGEQARAAAENLRNATSSLADANQKIADIEGAVNSQRALNANEVNDLCAKYPELQQYITATADGFKVEEGAMSLLSGVTNQFSTGYIQAQIKMSEAALAETQNRINLMQQEAGIMGKLDYATVAAKTDKSVMTEEQFRSGNSSRGYESYDQYLASFLDDDLAASYAQSSFSRFVYPEAVICPFAYQPCNAFTAAENPLAFFLADGEFAVGQIIAYFFLARHAEGDECISRLPFAAVNFLI